MIDLRYFKPEEFTMGDKVVYAHMNERFLKVLDSIRNNLGRPMTITSSYRTKEYNEEIGGAPNSMHCQGCAVDVYIGNWTTEEKRELNRILLDMDLTFGFAKTFVHIDNREKPKFWVY